MNFRFPRFKWRLQFSLLTLFGMMTAVAVGFGIAPTIRVQLAVRALSNNDIEVDGGPLGLMVKINSPAAEKLRHLGHQANSALVRALNDPERFAAAHVLLMEINENPSWFTAYKGDEASHWNEMQIDLFANGKVDFHAEQIPKLQDFWRNHLSKHRPGEEDGQAPIAVQPPR